MNPKAHIQKGKREGMFGKSMAKYTMTFHLSKDISTHNIKHAVDTKVTVAWGKC